MEFKPTEYSLENCLTHRRFRDSGWLLSDPEGGEPALIRAIYGCKQITFKEKEQGLYRFADWLPIRRALVGSAAPYTYKSSALANYLGLSNLYITFSGYWPEEGVKFATCSFKETEAYSVCGRLPKGNDKILVVASAGNTARAFAKVCSENNIPLVIAIPFDNLDALWFEEPLNSCVKVICSPKGSDYFDAIALAGKLFGSDKFLDEGGAKNVARRDGMATTVLSATEVIGHIPDAYFQAVGSGTGTIAAYEANLRLIEDGRFGKTTMRLFPSQNIPFTPMADAWEAKSRALLPFDEDEGRRNALKIKAKVLSNRKPPYSIAGGLFDALKATNGVFLRATNEELTAACELFERLEGIDIYSAAGVALVSLEKALAQGEVTKDQTIMLNITGGGERRFKRDYPSFATCGADLILSPSDPKETIIAKVLELFSK